MKNYLKYTLLIFLAGFYGCEPEFENSVDDPGFYSSGSADFSRYVAVGNSLTAGYTDGALFISAQAYSYPNLMASKFQFVGGGEFNQPLMNDNIGGMKLGGTQILPNRLVLSVDANGNFSPVRMDAVPTTDAGTKLSGSFQNLGVPGAKSYHLMAPGYGNVAGILQGTANPYFVRFSSSENATVIADAASQDPTFFSLWIGNNDMLGYATSGGSGVDQTGNMNPETYETNDITDPNLFAAIFTQQVDALIQNGAKGVVFNLPEVTAIPYFNTVPTRVIPLDASTAAMLNSQFEPYNNLILPGLQAAGIISSDEAQMRKINFVSGQNFPIMSDDELTDISNLLMGTPFNLPVETAKLLGQLRQINDDDLIVLTASSVIGTIPDTNNPLGIIGVSIPLEDQWVLTKKEQDRVKQATQAYNITIKTVAESRGLAFVDVNQALQRVANEGIPYDGGILTAQFVVGGTFSLDGVHPTPKGYAYITNLAIDAINRTYDATIPKVNVGDYPSLTLHNN